MDRMVDVPHARLAGRRALVLEPFADELQLGTDAGQPEVDALTRSGFTVDILRNAEVTVAALLRLSDYSVVYWDTHAAVLDNGDAVVVSGERAGASYSSYYQDHSLVQAFVAGDPSKTLYNGVTGQFIAAHLDAFPDDSIIFLNGCSALSASVFWQDLAARNVATLISWDEKAQSVSNERAAELVMDRLALGDTVDKAVAEARLAGLGTTIIEGVVAHLGYRGWGGDTLASALTGRASDTPTSTPTPTLMPTPTSTPVPTATPLPTAAPKPRTPLNKRKRHKCRPGQHRVRGKCR